MPQHGEPAGDAFLAIQKPAPLTPDMPGPGHATHRACRNRASGPHARHLLDTPPSYDGPLGLLRGIRGRRAPPGSTITGMAFERITVDPNRMGGVPCIRDLRVTVSMVLGQLAGGASTEGILADYPYLERADIMASLEYAAAIVNERELPVARPA
jgi:uncharacterized protein (DUF433 family)